MAVEIERKFLVHGEDWRVGTPTRIVQGYLNRDKERTVRVRLAGDRAYLTIKGATGGIARAEFEYEIPPADAAQLLQICLGPTVEKVRYRCVFEGALWEVDEFLGENAGLVVAEIELQHEAQDFARPPWLGLEVTGDPRYTNSNLSIKPFAAWGS